MLFFFFFFGVCVDMNNSERVYSFHPILKARLKTTGLSYQGIKKERLLIFLYAGSN